MIYTKGLIKQLISQSVKSYKVIFKCYCISKSANFILTQTDSQVININQQLESMMENPIPFSHKLFKLINGDPSPLLNTRILIVGVGGIGCEILKVLCKMPIAQVHIIDMDTIELSNLNRQFLFKKQHKGESKALMARETILKINPDFDIVAHHKNIKELPINFFKQFNFLVMALDNIEARNYVNKIGVRLNIPIIDAGTLGYKGNVTTIIPKQTRCYSCEPKSSQQKVFPVCTIRMRPEKPIHCIVWAKLLFEVLFGPENEDNDLKDLAELAKNNDTIDIMVKLFESDINSIKNAKEDSENKLSEMFAKTIRTIPKEELEKHIGSVSLDTFNRHDDKLTEDSNIAIFAEAFQRLNKQKAQDSVITFEKDDDNIIHFISSAANLRMQCFNIQRQSFNEIKNMAGNIVPAIASTNSIVSGIEIVEMMKLVKNKRDKMKSYFVQNLNTKVIGLKTEANLETCQICHLTSIPVIVQTNLSQFKLENLVQMIKEKIPSLEEFSINYGSKEFYNSDDPRESLLEKSILELCTAYEVDLVVTNEDTMKKVCTVWLIHDESLTETKIDNEEQLTLKKEGESEKIQEEKDEQNPTPEDDDDDIIVFEDEANSPDLEIIEVRKNPENNRQLNEPTDVNSQSIPIVEESRSKKEQPAEILIESDEEPKPMAEVQQQFDNGNQEDLVEVTETMNGNEPEKRTVSPMAEEENSSDSIKKKVKQNNDEE